MKPPPLSPVERRLLRECAIDLIRASDLTDHAAIFRRIENVRRDLDDLLIRTRPLRAVG